MAVGKMNIIRIILDTVTAGAIILLMDLQIIGLAGVHIYGRRFI